VPLIAILSFSLFQLGCAGRIKSEPTVVGSEGRAEGQWRGKALVRNLVSGQSATLSLDVIAREPNRLRMEIIGAFGVHVASVALNDGQVRYSLSQEKRFIVAPANSEALTGLVPVRLSPVTLLAILFDRNLPSSEWSCRMDRETGLAKSCEHRREAVSVNWIQREGLSRRLKIGAAEATIEMVLDEARSKVESGDAAFVLSPPSGYRVERH
jgi:hypothetical protein